MKTINNDTIYFAKVDSIKETKIPNKRVEDGAFDIYANFDEDYILLNEFQTVKIPTNLAIAFSEDYVLVLKERGSTGSIGLGQRAGVGDSGYRGEYFVPITNHNDVKLVIAKDDSDIYYYGEIESDNSISFHKTTKKRADCVKINNKFLEIGSECIVYPYSKAICQGMLVPVPKVKSEEISYEELLQFDSERGIGCLGSSGK